MYSIDNPIPDMHVHSNSVTALYTQMKNLIYHFPTCYAYSVKKPIWELNLKRALDEDTEVFYFFFSFLSSSSPLGQTAVSVNSMHPLSVILGVFAFFFFFILIFCESLALYAKSRGFIYTILVPKVK